ncbi:LysR family transcriptional regulator [Streptomyces netropsis]|uniref:DNA-binding transcriptional LysR family regulator n=1 Tax=Streptomyces netropsis TaxID=55404 RepID=A0A7W7LG58_STRNE|nr:LysR family transcriptional regulator [Streptomyces netropsis]MBB4889572.1 DNA-binding transcriptional LysR family regulator [Streptomyces netropsis]
MTYRLDFSLTQLLYFVTIAETRNISEAAARLHASQSAVSSAIQRLERQLGSQLLSRQHAKGVTLTPSGQLLLDDARKVLFQARTLKDHSSRLQGETAGHIDVGCCCTITPFLIPEALAGLAKSHPGLKVNLHDTRKPTELLRNGSCDLVVTYSFTPTEGRTFIELATPPLYCLIPQEHPLARAGHASLREIVELPLLMLNLSSDNAYKSYMESIFAVGGIPMPEVIWATGTEVMRSLVSIGAGFMLTHHRPLSLDTSDDRKNALVVITDDRPPLSIGVQMPKTQVSSQKTRHVIHALRKAASEIYAPAPRALLRPPVDVRG